MIIVIIVIIVVVCWTSLVRIALVGSYSQLFIPR